MRVLFLSFILCVWGTSGLASDESDFMSTCTLDYTHKYCTCSWDNFLYKTDDRNRALKKIEVQFEKEKRHYGSEIAAKNEKLALDTNVTQDVLDSVCTKHDEVAALPKKIFKNYGKSHPTPEERAELGLSRQTLNKEILALLSDKKVSASSYQLLYADGRYCGVKRKAKESIEKYSRDVQKISDLHKPRTQAEIDTFLESPTAHPNIRLSGKVAGCGVK